jgi:hypothetical protein
LLRILEQFLPIKGLKIEFVEARSIAFLQREINPVQQSFFRLRNSVFAIAGALFDEAPMELSGDGAIADGEGLPLEVAWPAGGNAGQDG